MDHIERLAEEFKLQPRQVRAAVELLDAGNTIPFIARYRKEMTGSMDDQVLREVAERLEYLRNLDKRREEIEKSLAEQGVLTEELGLQLKEARTLSELEDLYRPYRPKRRTRATIAKERGLEPLAMWLMLQPPRGVPEEEARKFIDAEKEVPDAETAALKEPQLKTEEGKLLMDGRTVSEKAVVAATDGVYVYYVEKIGLSSFVLRVTPVVNDGRLVQSRTRDAYAESFSDKAVTEPASLTVTREALTLTDTARNVTVMNLLTGEMASYPATTGRTAAACMQGGMLYRYLLTEEGHWVLESAAAVSTPTRS